MVGGGTRGTWRDTDVRWSVPLSLSEASSEGHKKPASALRKERVSKSDRPLMGEGMGTFTETALAGLVEALELPREGAMERGNVGVVGVSEVVLV